MKKIVSIVMLAAWSGLAQTNVWQIEPIPSVHIQTNAPHYWVTNPTWTTNLGTNAAEAWMGFDAAWWDIECLSNATEMALGLGTNASEPNLVHQSARMIGLTTNSIAYNGLAVTLLGLTLTNGFACADVTQFGPYGGYFEIVWCADGSGTNWQTYRTNVPVALGMHLLFSPMGQSSLPIPVLTNVVVDRKSVV